MVAKISWVELYTSEAMDKKSFVTIETAVMYNGKTYIINAADFMMKFKEWISENLDMVYTKIGKIIKVTDKVYECPEDIAEKIIEECEVLYEGSVFPKYIIHPANKTKYFIKPLNV